MYRTNNLGWKVTHVLCILGHLGLVVAAAVAYVYNLGREDDSRAAWLSSLDLNLRVSARSGVAPDPEEALRNVLVTALAMGAFGAAPGSFDAATHTLPIICMALVSPVLPQKNPQITHA